MAAEHARGLALLAGAQAAKGDLQGALRLMAQAVQADPQQAETQFRMGLLQQALGDDEAALRSLAASLALQPRNAVAFNVQGLSFKNLGRLEEAIRSYDEALRIKPDFFEALNNRGVGLRLLGRHEEAAASFSEALLLRPQVPALHNQLGITLHQLGRYAQAAEAFERVLSLDAGATDAAMNLGLARQELRQFDAALASLRRARALAPGNLEVEANLGSLLQEMGRLDEAVACLRGVAQARPADAQAQMNLGNVLRDSGLFGEAQAQYAKALALAPDDATIHWNESINLLTSGDYAAGWPKYEWRWRAPGLGNVMREPGVPLWSGREPLAGRTILLHAEQGLGDTLHLCRLARDVQALGARVVLEVQRPLLDVLKSLEGVDVLLGRGDALPAIDFHCPLLGLPLALGIVFDTIAQRGPYLHADPTIVEKWRGTVQGGAGLNVGLAWAGNPDYRLDHRRSIGLDTLLAALPAGPRYWSLQKEVREMEAPLLEPAGPVRRFAQNDFADTAAQMMLMDVVISVETSLAQLATALGRPTWVLLAKPADWRWGVAAASPWYPTARLFRQVTPNDWKTVLADVSAALKELPQ
ncbi:MAG: tetratricopeptide repeat protein [Burkholderiales bacterium]|nr:tetratricopeptide repeat protein [Burkholderiales bacterium]